LDTNDVFYIGKGTVNLKGKSEKMFYPRAFQKSKKDRTNWWHNITKKTSYAVEIVFQNTNESLILEKEKEFIKLYGRKNLNLGNLVNLCDCGMGYQQRVIYPEERERHRIAAFKRREYGHYDNNNKKIFVYLLDGTFYKEFKSYKEARRQLGFNSYNITLYLNGESRCCKKNTYLEQNIRVKK